MVRNRRDTLRYANSRPGPGRIPTRQPAKYGATSVRIGVYWEKETLKTTIFAIGPGAQPVCVHFRTDGAALSSDAI